ncbi:MULTISPECIES: DciA family protein [Arthrobacter]|uniref:DciA family protein n=2 Tax=Arthrobacter TaxID=1663 RepID=A0ABU9KJ04_9MICC|nr:DciA family protein [Arthrobacter sp. YJM1]MDP5226877.1 DciA family protein [Arthrobacter sp. YJM1]
MADDPRQGQGDGGPGDGPDAASDALRRARRAAELRGEVRSRSTSGSLEGPRTGKKRERPGRQQFTGGRDPQGVGAIMGRLIEDRGWSSPVAVGSVVSQWASFVGPEVAAHCEATGFAGTTLTVRCDSTAWAANMRLLRPSLLEKFRTEVGPGIVTVIEIHGPSAPSWKRGIRSVPGRGPRDTYG